jgi:hypothetical protein
MKNLLQLQAEITLSRHGRGQPVKTILLGEKKIKAGGSGETIDTSALKGFPLNDLISFAQQHSIDPSQAMADGINVHLESAARGTSGPSIQSAVLDSGLAATPEEARLVAMHIRQLSKRLGKEDSEMLEAMVALKAA